MKNNINRNVVHGFKAFRSDWTCSPNGTAKQYTCPGKFEEGGVLKICDHGMHFCRTAADCFKYYTFSADTKLAEVIAYGDVRIEGDKCCTNKLEIVREIPWEEVLRIVNFGKNCTGFCNSGNSNTGDYNTGINNSADYNSGDCNSGIRNSGNCNSGCHNSGNNNSGYFDTGNNNSGDYNSGDCNSGDWNTGNYNSGDYNTGDWNRSSFNTGCFNTSMHKIMLFDKPSEWTYVDWLRSDARHLLLRIPHNEVKWIYSEHMSDEEKAAHASYRTTGGYLKALDKSECGQMWWNSLSDRKKNIIKSIPNFDADIFFQCTGIRVDG